MAARRGIGRSHHRAPAARNQHWLTPPELLAALGPFDLDPCCPDAMPWRTAARMLIDGQHDGLREPWAGRVWLNPPYGLELGKWLQRLAAHGNGIALTFARIETRSFFDHVWPRASALLFLKGRLTFRQRDGSMPKKGHNSGGPSVLIAYGKRNASQLRRSGLVGAFVDNYKLIGRRGG